MRGFMMENLLELVIIGVALGLCQDRSVPALLIMCNVIVQAYSWYSSTKYSIMVGHCESGLYQLEKCDGFLMQVYFSYGAFFILVAMISFLCKTRMSVFTAIVLSIQGMISTAMVGVVYHGNANSVTHDNLFDLYSSINTKFAILYCVVAWICVYFSRRANV